MGRALGAYSILPFLLPGGTIAVRMERLAQGRCEGLNLNQLFGSNNSSMQIMTRVLLYNICLINRDQRTYSSVHSRPDLGPHCKVQHFPAVEFFHLHQFYLCMLSKLVHVLFGMEWRDSGLHVTHYWSLAS